MAPSPAARDLATFESHRPELVALAYRMLGDVGRAQDVVQEAWLRWRRRRGQVDSPKAYLLTVVTRLCLNELDSARARREESRSNRLPEPVDLDAGGMALVEDLDRISMAFLVILQRLSAAERAVFLLHDVFDFDHGEIAEIVGKSAAACRKLLERARKSIAAGRAVLRTSRPEHRRLLQAFVRAATAGDVGELIKLLTKDVVIVTDGGLRGARVGNVKNLSKPLEGADRVAAFVVAATRRGAVLQVEERELNGQPAIVFRAGDRPFAAMLLAVAKGKVQRIFFHADSERLSHLGPPSAPSK